MLDILHGLMSFIWSFIVISGALGGSLFLILMCMASASAGEYFGLLWARMEGDFRLSYRREKQRMIDAVKGGE